MKNRRTYKIVGTSGNYSYSPSSVGASSSATHTITCKNVKIGEQVIVGFHGSAAPTDGLGICGAYVSAADTIKVTFINGTGGGITPPTPTTSAPYKVTVIDR
jgi:hypothetical protein